MDKQVFQTDSRQRWNRFKWTLRVLLTIAILLGAVFLAMFALEESPQMPFRHDYRSVVSAGKPFLKDNKTSKEYKSFRDFFHEQRMHSNDAHIAAKQHRFVGKANSLTQKYIAEWTDSRMGIRSAWYVNWDKRAYLSLKNNIKHLNMVLPEWFFINPNTDQLESRIDKKALKLMRSAGIPILPMLTNNYGAKFRSEPIARIMNNQEKRMALIKQLADQCEQYGFTGINLDLEDLNITDNVPLITLVKDFATVFHARGLYVTQAIAAFNDDYDMQELAKYDDYLFLMAYDEHNSTSQPGAISSQRWVEKATDWAAKNVPNDKIVLGLAAYGYDWTEGKPVGSTVSFDQIIATAQNAEAKIAFNDDTYNLNFSYEDNTNGTLHHVFFPDASTTFNIMRFGSEYHLAGFGLWRLGTEDKRIWRFYGKDMAWENAAKLSIAKLMQLNGTDDVNFVGSGEVLNVTSEPHHGKIAVTMDKDNCLITEEYYRELPTTYTVQRLGKCKPKQLVITFDDGPDERWTPSVLSTLKKYKVPAAFFMVGLQMEKNLPLVKQVFDAGHTIGNHTFTHHDMSENSDRRSYAELKLTRMLIESVTGQSTILFRAPYNADADPTGHEEIWPMIIASRRNYLFVGESIDPNDWQQGVTADQIYKRVIDGVHNEDGHIILLHDAGGATREPTITALPRIIETLQREGYQFISLEQYLGMSRQTLMPPIEKGKVYYAMQANLSLAEFIYHISDFLTALFLVFLVLGFVRLLFMYILMIREKRAENHRNYAPINAKTAPEVSIIVPAYNEEVNIVRTINNLKQQDYPNFHIYLVDDGSKDNTLKRVHERFDNDTAVTIIGKENGGKASALNLGIATCTTKYVVCIDADTQLLSDAVSKLMRHFIADKTGRIGAVAGNVKVGNSRNILTYWQAIEYTTSQNFDRMAYSNINAITVVPGAIGAFRKKVLEEVGGFTTDTLAEDCDLTMCINERGYIIENENYAVAMTEVPETLRQFVKQRIRWCFGVMQTFWKHRSSLFATSKKGFGMWAMPNMLIFQYIIPTFSPLADILMIIGLFTGNAAQVFAYYLVFLLVDASVSIMAYIFEHERLWVLLWIIPQRFFYRWIMYYVLFKSYLKAIKGELQTWGVLKRTGHVKNK
ncbi:glycosyltransferase [Prevotella pallens]|jgi:glycosyl transferase, group 2 family protein/polysaccharide deacetylase family protein|uniref:glycosyltransferase n=1 Tax=Prevotella pallens TaxID=60133 RepID=UPI001CAEAFA7|nr:glycosyltransferase [Prevotella pallens]MBF1498799.1 glycosyltransferase [Prevotella pallens]